MLAVAVGLLAVAVASLGQGAWAPQALGYALIVSAVVSYVSIVIRIPGPVTAVALFVPFAVVLVSTIAETIGLAYIILFVLLFLATLVVAAIGACRRTNGPLFPPGEGSIVWAHGAGSGIVAALKTVIGAGDAVM